MHQSPDPTRRRRWSSRAIAIVAASLTAGCALMVLAFVSLGKTAGLLTEVAAETPLLPDESVIDGVRTGDAPIVISTPESQNRSAALGPQVALTIEVPSSPPPPAPFSALGLPNPDAKGAAGATPQAVRDAKVVASSSARPAASAVSAGPVTAGPSNGVACGQVVCAAGQECCNSSCGICTAPGERCSQRVCGLPSMAQSERCGMNTCNAGQVCCNSSCGICKLPGESCSQDICG